MTTNDPDRAAALRQQQAGIKAEIEHLEAREREVRLAIEEAEGRGDGREAVWLRAIINHDHETSERCFAEWVLGDGARFQADHERKAKELLTPKVAP